MFCTFGIMYRNIKFNKKKLKNLFPLVLCVICVQCYGFLIPMDINVPNEVIVIFATTNSFWRSVI